VGGEGVTRLASLGEFYFPRSNVPDLTPVVTRDYYYIRSFPLSLILTIRQSYLPAQYRRDFSGLPITWGIPLSREHYSLVTRLFPTSRLVRTRLCICNSSTASNANPFSNNWADEPPPPQVSLSHTPLRVAACGILGVVALRGAKCKLRKAERQWSKLMPRADYGYALLNSGAREWWRRWPARFF